ncbi:multicopper oxidase domain-containing protein [Sphingomonas sp. FUKUSWIS1]|uniref:multicopper oxidase domain-containing protein n=1 Tax=Sphingomonas sp. FUKUSWIS1 TaxID=1379701 RepID=UPI0006932604|nr:multicopper oxidase domain-containing protein [Sphingomonas sp. FUKUSWIS1]
MERRDFLKIGAGATTVALAATAQQMITPTDTPLSSPAPTPMSLSGSSDLAQSLRLVIEPVEKEMIDGKIVYMVFYFHENGQPQPVLRYREGEPVSISVTNNDLVPHGFAITGMPQATVPEIPPGQTRQVPDFVAPVGGSYLYHDPYEPPLNRILGLHGAFIVDPALGTTVAGSATPFSRAMHTPQIAAVFDAFGRHPRFPGERWKAGDPARDKLWLFSQTDSAINARVASGYRISGQALIDAFLPDYFHINGLSGFDTAVHDTTASVDRAAAQAIEPVGKQGQPTLLRVMNAGLCTHSAHIHGNHLFECTEADASGVPYCETNVYERDVWIMRPMDRKDMILPFERPPDVPVWPPREEPFPLKYVMHCHTEMSQTAGGGNYPQGLVTHWTMTSPIYAF